MVRTQFSTPHPTRGAAGRGGRLKSIIAGIITVGVAVIAAFAYMLDPGEVGSAPDGTVTASTDINPGQGAEVDLYREMLASLEVKGRAPRTGYERELFGPAWSDDVTVEFGHNGCDTRNDILHRDLREVQAREGTRGCVVHSGILDDPYSGEEISFLRGQSTSSAVQIDHIVPLADAWQKGAQQWDETTRRNFANDPDNLLAVDGPLNQQKGAGDAATWLPPERSYRCEYARSIITVKDRYRVWVTDAEKQALSIQLDTCTPAQ